MTEQSARFARVQKSKLTPGPGAYNAKQLPTKAEKSGYQFSKMTDDTRKSDYCCVM